MGCYSLQTLFEISNKQSQFNTTITFLSRAEHVEYIDQGIILARRETTERLSRDHSGETTKSKDDNDGIELSSTGKVDTGPGYDVVASSYHNPST